MLPDDEIPMPTDDDAPSNVTPIGKAKRVRKPKAVVNTELEIDVADRFAAKHEGEVHFAAGLDWLTRNKHSKCWERDTAERVRELAKGVIADMRKEAAALDDQQLWKLASDMASARGISGLLALARSDERLRIDASAFDAARDVLACSNGVVNLRDATIREYTREDRFTRCAPTAYIPDAQSPVFERLLLHLFPDEQIRGYIKRAIGYSLTSAASEDSVFLLVGPARCGKSTFLSALDEALGPHFAYAAMRSFCASRTPGGNPPRSDLFRLTGRRIVAASEIHPGQEFDVGLLKSISGGEPIPVRDLQKSEIAPRVTYTLWLVCNEGDLPRMRSEDDAVWERVRRIPVGSTLPEAERDRSFRGMFARADVRAAVLAWAVDGAREWYQHGLGAPPASVRAATSALRQEMDPCAPFIDALVHFDASAVTPKRTLREMYERWSEDRGEHAAGAKRLAAALRTAAARAGATVGETTTREAGKVVPAWRGLRAVREDECRDVETCRGPNVGDLSTRAGEESLSSQPLQPSTPLQTDWDDQWEEGRE